MLLQRLVTYLTTIWCIFVVNSNEINNYLSLTKVKSVRWVFFNLFTLILQNLILLDSITSADM